MKTETIESIADIGSKVTTVGASASMIGTFLMNNMIGVIGLLIALVGHFTNAYYKHKADKRHAAESERNAAEAELRAQLLRSGVFVAAVPLSTGEPE
jgi:hypothetical protein